MEILQELIPAAKLTAVKNALLQTFNTIELEEISLLTGGLSASKVYKIVVKHEHYVLKLDGSPAAPDDIYNSCMKIAADGGIAPPVYYLNKETGIAITGFIKSMPLVFNSPDRLLSELAKTIRKIHELPQFAQENSLQETVEGLLAQFKLSKMLTGPVFEESFAYYEEIRNHYPWHDMDKVSSHNDLNPNNIVFDGEKIWIIDWDAAFKNDRYVDLAIIANFYVSTDVQEENFLKVYFGSDLTQYNRARFFIMRQICRLVYAMLMFKLADASIPMGVTHDADMQKSSLKEVKRQLGNGELSLAAYNGQLAFGKALLNEALDNMKSIRFSGAIAQLNSKPGALKQFLEKR